MQNSSEILAVSKDQVGGLRQHPGKDQDRRLRNTKQVIDTYVSKILVYPKSVEICSNFSPSITLELEEGVMPKAVFFKETISILMAMAEKEGLEPSEGRKS